MGEGKQTCVQCNGTGWWQYDHNHAAVCRTILTARETKLTELNNEANR